jgi:hypothetical protein
MFFVNKKLHKVLWRSLAANLVEAWDYGARTKVTMLYTDFAALSGKALNTSEAAALMGVNTKTIDRAIYSGGIETPQKSYGLEVDELGSWRPTGSDRYRYWFGIDDMLELHDYLLTTHVGRPRRDGKATPNPHMVSRAEVVAAMTDRMVLYAKKGDKYVVAYAPPEF